MTTATLCAVVILGFTVFLAAALLQPLLDWHDRRQERATQEAADQAAAEARFRRDVERALKRLDDDAAVGGVVMSERIRVTEAELRDHWFSDAATGMVHDYSTQTKVVRMEDGTEYETPFDELGGES